jgi:secreted Zn-dependent insulinase-like peptidase
VLLDLMVMCLLQSMVEDVYPADLAQLSYSLYAAESGVVVKCSGLSDKLPRLLETILQHFQTLHTRRGFFCCSSYNSPSRVGLVVGIQI